MYGKHTFKPPSGPNHQTQQLGAEQITAINTLDGRDGPHGNPPALGKPRNVEANPTAHFKDGVVGDTVDLHGRLDGGVRLRFRIRPK